MRTVDGLYLLLYGYIKLVILLLLHSVSTHEVGSL